ncbi:MAG: MltA domain-containing protein, partial [Candidatus Binatia bacterium]
MRPFRLLLLCLVFLAACSGNRLTRELDSRLYEDDLDRDSLQQAIQRSLDYLDRLPPDRVLGEWPRRVTAREVQESLLAFTEHLDLLDQPERLWEAIGARFDLYESVSDKGYEDNLFTGYYQPVVEGSLTETPAYRFPIYRRPDDLIEIDPSYFAPRLHGEKAAGRIEGNRLVPYFSRHEIDRLDRLRGKGYEIAWAKDPVELFFLHIQGSGILRLEDGRFLPINYHASNGRPYTSIGKLLLQSGKIAGQDSSMQSLKRYLNEHPQETEALFAQNESYVFFRFGDNGPLGSLDVPLT